MSRMVLHLNLAHKMKYKLIVLSLFMATATQAQMILPESAQINSMVGAVKSICGNKEGAVEHYTLAHLVIMQNGVDENTAQKMIQDFVVSFMDGISGNPVSEMCENIDHYVAQIIASNDLISSE